jgi:hypothetical protein
VIVPAKVKLTWKVVGKSRVRVPVVVSVPLAPANRPVPPVIVYRIVKVAVVGFTGTHVDMPDIVTVSPLTTTTVVVIAVVGPVTTFSA